MGLFSRFENKAEDVIEGSGGSRKGGIEPVKLAKRAAKEMEREKMVGVGHEYAPTLYNVLVSADDDEHMNGFYPSLAGEIETYLTSRAEQTGLVFDCPPLVRFIVDDGLKRGRFDIIAESVSPAIIAELRHEEMVHYGLEDDVPDPSYGATDGYSPAGGQSCQDAPAYQYEQPAPPQGYERLVEQHYGRRPADQPAAWQPQEAPEAAPAPAPVSQAPAPAVPGEAAAVAQQPAAPVAPAVPAQPPVQPAAMPQQPAAPAPQTAAGATVMIDEPVAQRRMAVLYDYATRRQFKLLTDRTVIGREASCDVVIGDPSVSRRHAEVLHGANGWLIRDTGSTNGTTVNGTATTQSRIYNGDIISLGNTQLEFQEG